MGSLVGEDEWKRRIHYDSIGEEIITPRLKRFRESLAGQGRYLNYWHANTAANERFIEVAKSLGFIHLETEIYPDNSNYENKPTVVIFTI